MLIYTNLVYLNNHNPTIKEVRFQMANRKSTIPFSSTPEQDQALDQVLAELKGTRGALMPALQRAQDIFGYLPIEVQERVALGLDVPLEEVYGVATFYSQFTLNPKGRYKFSVCLGTACYVKGSGDLYEALKEKLGIDGGECTADGKFSLEACRCIGACGLAPVLTINDDVYGRLIVDDLDDILAKYQN